MSVPKTPASRIDPHAGKPPSPAMLVDLVKLTAAYYAINPDPTIPAQRVAFGTSGHRGSSFDASFNEAHVLAISQAICEYRVRFGITGPLFLGIDTHALSIPARDSVLEVLSANGVAVMLAENDEYTPTPAISHAIIVHNRGRKERLADGIVITPSHNPPDAGGYKYNPPHGGPADVDVSGWIEARANSLLETRLRDVKRVQLADALRASTTHRHDYLRTYVNDLRNVVDMDALHDAHIHIGADPMGGAGVHYWRPIAERYGLNLTVVNDTVDATFRFMPCDWDGRIRMDPSSQYAMQNLIASKDRFDIAFACDTDHDRHGIVTQDAGLLPANHFLAVAVDYLFTHRPRWRDDAAVGKSVVASAMIDRVAARLGRDVREVPVGFKWFVAGLSDGSLAFCGEESAGATFARRDGSVWTTDKDGIVPALLAAEITARTGRDPGELYAGLEKEFGEIVFAKEEAPASRAQKQVLTGLTREQVRSTTLAGDAIEDVLTNAPGNGAAIGGLKVLTKGGWFAARPSGTEDLYKIYAESFRGEDHLQRIVEEAQAMVDDALSEGV